ncbi:bifunctional phosphopantothenoylcysteine decarboxylase/phosphopantothenate--cysteine ligase CoaBC [Rothia sp. ZJ1223]|uniref:bifunctional phosphopantothenoylcysteine decarboxylase/phosphopantothenate--cysteine ligase CoaBC n=1 Tax=Rothia sp. ZJ1223 TaxID=2811098 RepID=UPI001959BC78|nr:bifunctional phosphopantothenoylcysteine decarboxylase/phosphopantothenate--cysteine ligase CoaBC [Rothia sp. ZJ1223]MBM7050508.1 bifunctional phosphopantothenoylcysteine decarboxylase/phosphopantothenate--cysteine ligase CoaBC [Rothia sp. ZJ1223]
MRIVVGIGGGIAAYKATMLLRLFSKAGHEVIAMPTAAALEFVGKPTLEALSSNEVSVSVFERVPQVNHVAQAEQCDAVVIAPATADLMARLAIGRADDLLSATVLTTHAPVILAPAMHTQMWEHPATVKNVETLRSFGYHVIDPAVGRLTGPDSGVGRMPEPEDIFAQALEIISSDGGVLDAAAPAQPQAGDLAGRRVLVTAGGTREPLDPVRFLGNRSSGKQGVAIAQAAVAAGAHVTLIAAHMEVEPPADVRVIKVSTADELHREVLGELNTHDVLVMAAAVADFKPAQFEASKIKKTDDPHQVPTIELVRNPDILKDAVAQRGTGSLPATIVGFAAETGDATTSALEFGRAKLQRKGCDLLVVNEVGETKGFGQDTNEIFILNRRTDDVVNASGSKYDVAVTLMRSIAQQLNNN